MLCLEYTGYWRSSYKVKYLTYVLLLLSVAFAETIASSSSLWRGYNFMFIFYVILYKSYWKFIIRFGFDLNNFLFFKHVVHIFFHQYLANGSCGFKNNYLIVHICMICFSHVPFAHWLVSGLNKKLVQLVIFSSVSHTHGAR